MAKLKQKGWRITQELDQLIQDMKPPEMSESAYVTKVLYEALTGTKESGNNGNSGVSAVIVEQLTVKDEQIASLSRALEAAQETAKAAQALHAVDRREDLALESAGQKLERGSRWARLREAWRG